MKHYLHRLFEFMGKPENFNVSVILIILYTFFIVIIGMLLAWLISLLVDAKIERKRERLSFDDMIERNYGNGYFNIRRVK